MMECDGDCDNREPTTFQKQFIEDCIKKVKDGSKECFFAPADPMVTLRPKLEAYYLKPVMVWAPKMRYSIDIRCNEDGCAGNLSANGFLAAPRYVHGMTTGFYFIQCRYKCEQCKKTVAAIKCQLPYYLSETCPVIFSHKSALHKEVVTFVTSAATTGMSFTEITKYLGTSRQTCYLEKKTNYLIMKKRYEESSLCSSHLTPLRLFSAFDDKQGYNEIASPTEVYLENFFTSYVHEHSKMIDNLQKEAPICQVISSDHTFNVAKRSSKNKNATLFITMGGDGQILEEDWGEGTGSTTMILHIRIHI